MLDITVKPDKKYIQKKFAISNIIVVTPFTSVKDIISTLSSNRYTNFTNINNYICLYRLSI